MQGGGRGDLLDALLGRHGQEEISELVLVQLQHVAGHSEAVLARVAIHHLQGMHLVIVKGAVMDREVGFLSPAYLTKRSLGVSTAHPARRRACEALDYSHCDTSRRDMDPRKLSSLNFKNKF